MAVLSRIPASWIYRAVGLVTILAAHLAVPAWPSLVFPFRDWRMYSRVYGLQRTFDMLIFKRDSISGAEQAHLMTKTFSGATSTGLAKEIYLTQRVGMGLSAQPLYETDRKMLVEWIRLKEPAAIRLSIVPLSVPLSKYVTLSEQDAMLVLGPERFPIYEAP